jgi:pimeloyl-ACP methyl ester carboxylesterase
MKKMMRMWHEEPDIALSELAGVRAPVLLMQGDDDIVKVEHSATLAATLPDAQLAVIPGTSHMAPLEKPDLVNRLILDFLSDHQPGKVMSLRG